MAEEPKLMAVGEMAGIRGTRPELLMGVMAFMGWKAGRSVTAAEYDAAVEAFRKAPADGRK